VCVDYECSVLLRKSICRVLKREAGSRRQVFGRVVSTELCPWEANGDAPVVAKMVQDASWIRFVMVQ
jgi:hypothetical protein